MLNTDTEFSKHPFRSTNTDSGISLSSRNTEANETGPEM